MKTLLVILLFASFSLVQAAQVITIPEGQRIFGPIATSQLDKITEIQFERTSNAFTILRVTFQYSPDNQKTWIQYGKTGFPGGGATTASLGSIKELPDGVSATHIRIIADAVGGPVNITQEPTIQVRGKQ